MLFAGGVGPPILCLHGFGETAECFSGNFDLLKKSFSVYAIDLPHHGKSAWNQNDAFRFSDLELILDEIKLRSSFEKISLFGFSLGGKLALSVAEKKPNLLSNLILAAPDGLKKNIWYNLAVYPGWGHWFFRRVIRRPGLLLKPLQMARWFGIVNLPLYKFVTTGMKTEKQRQQVYDVWMSMKLFSPDLSRIRKNLADNNTPVLMIFGKYDRIILPKFGEKIYSEKNVQIQVLDCGHRVLAENLDSILEKFLNRDIE